MNYEFKTKLVAEIKDGKTSNLEQFNQRERELRKAIWASGSTYKAEGKIVRNQIALDFPK